MKKYILSLLVMIFLLSCDSKENQVNFTIIQVNDVYEIGPLSGGTVGGMSRVATLYKKEKALNDNTMMVLAGDFLSPSLLGTLKYKGEKIAGKQIVDVMNAMGFDLVVLGNHEFDVKRHELQKRIDASKMTSDENDTSENLPALYHIMVFDGLPHLSLFKYLPAASLCFSGLSSDAPT